MKLADHFEVSGYEVLFLQDAPVTVCVIRSLTDRHQKYTGISVCHPDDKWNKETGRHKALKNAINESKKFELCQPIETRYAHTTATMTFSAKRVSILPVKEIKCALMNHGSIMEKDWKGNWEELSKRVFEENQF